MSAHHEAVVIACDDDATRRAVQRTLMGWAATAGNTWWSFTGRHVNRGSCYWIFTSVADDPSWAALEPRLRDICSSATGAWYHRDTRPWSDELWCWSLRHHTQLCDGGERERSSQH